MMKRTLVILWLLLFFGACARIVIPTGGAKDTVPPKVTAEHPENQSLFFNAKTIRITFDEYVTLNNPVENIIFSPPLSHNPEYLISGKSLIIKLKDTLLPNKTYNVVFVNAIKDFHENNLLNLYQYTFSTGAFIDSCMLQGNLINAETLEPETGVYVFLYEDDIDSLPLIAKPTYLTKTQKGGTFTFQNIANKTYKIFALKDINGNLIFDLPNEGIAFLDTLQAAYPIPIKDTMKKQTDTLNRDLIDTVNKKQTDALLKKELRLYYFMEEDTVQRLERPQNPQKNIYKIIYKMPVNTFIVRQLTPQKKMDYFEVYNPQKDTITWYFKTNIPDSLVFEIQTDAQRTDTVLLKPFKAPAAQSGGRGRRAVAVPKLNVTHSHAGSLFVPLTLHFSFPVQSVDTFPVTVISNKKSGGDTTHYYYSIPDTFTISLPLVFSLEEKVPYVVLIKDSLFFGFDGTTNDSIKINFTAKSERDYGNLLMNYKLKGSSSPHIILLLDSRKNIVQQDIISSSQSISYKNLNPGEYKIKVIEDVNGNGKWDTGSYAKKRQPEKIFFFNKSITIRGYWDLEETFDMDAVKSKMIIE